MKLVGTMSLFWFPMWELCLRELAKHTDELYLRIDPNANPDIARRVSYLTDLPIMDVLESKQNWNKWNWREELMRMADRSEPSAVLNLDEDEVFCEGIVDEVKEFLGTKGKHMMMCKYHTPLPTIDGMIPNHGKSYPGKPHAKVYRWMPGITFKNYRSFAQATTFHKPNHKWPARTKILHYCWFTKALRDRRRMGHQ